MKFQFPDSAIQNDTFLLVGAFTKKKETGDEPITITLQFRRATNGGIVNTIVNGEPLITTNGW